MMFWAVEVAAVCRLVVSGYREGMGQLGVGGGGAGMFVNHIEPDILSIPPCLIGKSHFFFINLKPFLCSIYNYRAIVLDIP